MLCPSSEPRLLGPPFPKVGVIVVTWNRRDYVIRLLDSLARSAYPDWEVWVVDNASADGTAEAVRERHPWVSVIRNEENLGGSGGFNTGLATLLRRGGYDYLWLLDNDVEVERGALEVLVETLEQRPDAAVAGSHMIQLDHPGVTNEIGGMADVRGGRVILHHHRSPAWSHRAEIYEVDYVAACSLLVRFSVAVRAGLWDDLFIHSDDVDWCLRIRQAGYKVLACAASRIRHMSANVKRTTWVLYYDLRNMLHLKIKHGDFGFAHYFLFAVRLLKYAVRDEIGGKTYHSRLAWLALVDFLRGRTGKCDRLPPLLLEPAAGVLARIRRETPRRVAVFLPTSRPVFAADELAAMRDAGVDLLGVTHEYGDIRPGMPSEYARVPVPSGPVRRLLWMASMFLRGQRVDWLILDIDRISGLFGLLARRIVLLVDDQCLCVEGGAVRLFRALQWPLKWICVFGALAAFWLVRRRRRAADTRRS